MPNLVAGGPDNWQWCLPKVWHCRYTSIESIYTYFHANVWYVWKGMIFSASTQSYHCLQIIDKTFLLGKPPVFKPVEFTIICTISEQIFYSMSEQFFFLQIVNSSKFIVIYNNVILRTNQFVNSISQIFLKRKVCSFRLLHLSIGNEMKQKSDLLFVLCWIILVRIHCCLRWHLRIVSFNVCQWNKFSKDYMATVDDIE